ncbi:quinone oxidoreductase family protein [Corynebacterium lowii]|uniref:quinone oxidoreductase family protein n=1 Tax=Corynebacterium lowii TaxID=1544413 RepID=UPI0009E8491F|nr:NADP-dependent oxidoreductase [Corynebacterium lowii]MDP9850992.1 NADPH:quinone reductase-like Zn-dependent oxidoreductase [Corynebacterium lowii]
MKVIQHRFGGPETLEVVESEPENPGADEVLVKVSYAGVNPIDIMTRNGGGMAGLMTLPYTLGWDLSGTVEVVGEGVNLALGQRVCGLVRFPQEGGAYASSAVVPADNLVPVPENLSDEAAAALPLAAMTAWQAFQDTTVVEEGQRVLITGAGGGVGHLAVQLAHHLGLRWWPLLASKSTNGCAAWAHMRPWTTMTRRRWPPLNPWTWCTAWLRVPLKRRSRP